MNKVTDWLMLNRKPIGYAGAAANLVLAGIFYLMGDSGLALVWTVLGIMLAFSTYEMS